jgi:hypothetical protein
MEAKVKRFKVGPESGGRHLSGARMLLVWSRRRRMKRAREAMMERVKMWKIFNRDSRTNTS